MVSLSVSENNLGDAVAGVAVRDDDVIIVVVDAAFPLLHALRSIAAAVASKISQSGRGQDHAVRGASAVPPRPLPLDVGRVVDVARRGRSL